MAIMQDKPANAADAYTAMHKVICKIAHKFAKNNHRDYDDYFQYGCEGLMKAYERFDPTKQMAFSSYAYMWIFAWIKDHTVKDWKVYNNTAWTELDENNGGEYELDIDEAIDFERKILSSDPIDQQIVAARTEGYTFQEIAEALTRIGQPHTLHQVRNRMNNALEIN